MINMDEDWDAEVCSGVTASETFQNGTGNVPKLRGFGRGKPINLGSSSTMSNNRTMNGAGSNGFGRQSSGGTITPHDTRDDDWGDSLPVGGSTKSSGGNGAVSDDWDDTSPPASRFGGRSGGGNRGGGFGDRGGGRGCHKCGEEGHFARDCPSGGGGGSRGGDKGGRGCHKCGEEGHFARDCPSGGRGISRGGGGGGKGCHKCGEEGHFARDCPSGGGGGGGGGGRGRNCHKCGEEGHFARDCPNADGDGGFGGSRREGRDSGGGGGGGFGRKQGGFSKGSRGGFGNAGAAGDDGENEGSRGGRFLRGRNGDGGDGAGGRARGCQKCGEEGHFARECPNSGGGGGGKGRGCHKCGGDGHFARECPKAAADGEKPREIYVPAAVDDDTLFSEGIHQGINFDKYDNIQVLVTGNNKIEPISTFEDANLLPSFLKNIQRAGYIKPTPIQKYAIPYVMAGRDLMGCAQTGSGKTAAFILPVLTAMLNDGLTCSPLSPIKEPQTVVVAPTRELACQIYHEARKFSLQSEVRPVVVYGGVSVVHQTRQVEAGCNLVVGTPGRLLDFVEKGKISLAKVKFLILDEADRMLDMGFEPSIRKLVDSLGMTPKSQRQTLMFSATFKAEIQKLAADFMNDYMFITVGIVGGACTDVEQTFLEVDRMKKREYLCDILNTSGTNRVLVFVGQKRNADFLASYLSQSGYPTTTIHGDRLQREREEALADFKKGKSPVLIATNVAARGLDIPDVTHVVNYDLPSDIDEYVHRIGRTGRCGNLGKATSFYSNDTDQPLASSLVRILSEARQEVPDWLADYAAAGGAGAGGHFSGRFASKDIRHKRFDNGSSFPKGGGNLGHDADYGGSYGGAGDCGADEEVWD